MRSISAKLVMVIVVLGAMMTACKDKDSEKRIAELESRLSELEGTSTPAKTNTATTPATPDQKPEGPLPAFEWDATEHDFGTIKEGDKVNYTYKFKNSGEVPLIIENVRPSCGCTAPHWSKEPIPVGGVGEVQVEFNSKGKKNAQNKTVTVTANTWPKTTTLRFKTFVTPEPK